MDTPLRVLIVEDSEDDMLLLVQALRRGGYAPTFERVETPAAMTIALNQQAWDVVISDYAMPYFSAPDALALLKESGLDLPFIIVSGAIGEEMAVEMIRAGAHDYIRKDNLVRLAPAIGQALRDAEVRRDHRRAEEALRESEERYRVLFEQSKDAIYVTTREGQFVELNQAGLALFGLTEEELVEVNTRDLYVHPADRCRFQQEIEQRGFARDFEVELHKKDGTKMDCVLTSSVRRAVDGNILGYQGIIHDLTEHKRLEEQVRQQDRLAALGQLAGGIAHDFNNVLMTIILYAEMLSEEPSLPQDLAADVESILEEAQEAARLVRQVLDFSRRSPMETRLVDMRAFVQESVDMLRRTLPESISLLLEVGSDECMVNADPTQIQQVVMNLVVNARDAMPGGGELRLGLSRLGEEPLLAEMDAGKWVCLSVSDTGTGIAPDVLPRIFEPFFTTKPRGEGTGLGLAQVYGIVKQHGGHIGVETEVGQGTTFRIYLLAQEVQETEEGWQEEVALAPLEGDGETILVAEDEEGVRGLSQRILEALGYRVLTAANGREAMEVYRSAEKVDLVLTDMVMPEMGGKELIQELRTANPYLKAVVMTGYVLAENLRQLKEEGSLEIVHKPLDTNTLARVVRHALDGDG